MYNTGSIMHQISNRLTYLLPSLMGREKQMNSGISRQSLIGAHVTFWAGATRSPDLASIPPSHICSSAAQPHLIVRTETVAMPHTHANTFQNSAARSISALICSLDVEPVHLDD